MSDKELEGRLKDIHKKLEEIEDNTRDCPGLGTILMVLFMFMAFLSHGCDFK
jgi:hypothetical protein